MSQFWYKGTSKCFVESIYSIEAVKTVFFTSLNESPPKRSTVEMLSRLYLKYSHQYLEVSWRVSVFYRKNWDNEERSEYLFW